MSAFRANLAREGVREHLRLRGRLGIMAFHGGALERVTDVIAHEVALQTDASAYIVTHPDDAVHVPSTEVDPEQSADLAAFLAHVETAVALHGFGRAGFDRSVLLGGRNRALAEHLCGALSTALPDYDIVSDMDRIPVRLAGQHERNPVNRPPRRGVQIELPPVLRWNIEHHGWSDSDGTPRAPQVVRLIDALVVALGQWQAHDPPPRSRRSDHGAAQIGVKDLG